MENRRCMTLAEQKRVMLDILKTFADYCDRHNLMYYLDAGTLIGAVRHKGFIPWDDDIDVNMPMKDYDEFCRQMRSRGGHLTENLVVEFPDATIYPFLKISDNRTILVEFPHRNPMTVGVYIDIFPKYGIKDKGIMSRFICGVCEKMDLMHWFNTYTIKKWKNHSRNVLQRIGGTILDFFNICPHWPITFQNWVMHTYAKRHPLSECGYVTTLTNGEFNKLAPKECFDGYMMLEFEGCQFKAPIDYDTYLHCLYTGDYMQLPPEDKRVHHITEVYWK